MVNLECSPDLRMFLCALYAPVCVVYGRVSLPCRSLCQRSRDQCHKLMDIFGVSWPEDMDCSRCVCMCVCYLTRYEALALMVPPPRFPDCDEPYPRPEDLLPDSDPTNQSSMTVQRDYGFWCPRELKVDPDLGYTFMGRRDCSAPCPSMFFSQQELALIRYVIGVTSVVCLSATLFTFLTFLIDVTRFGRPGVA